MTLKEQIEAARAKLERECSRLKCLDSAQTRERFAKQKATVGTKQFRYANRLADGFGE